MTRTRGTKQIQTSRFGNWPMSSSPAYNIFYVYTLLSTPSTTRVVGAYRFDSSSLTTFFISHINQEQMVNHFITMS